MSSTEVSKIAFYGSGDGLLRLKSGGQMSASILRSMYDNPAFCDVTLFGAPPTGVEVSTLRPIRAHKVSLAYASSHLYDLFTVDGFVDSHQAEYTLENVGHQSLQSIVEFIHTDNLVIDADNVVQRVRGILIAAKYLVMPDLADACEAFLGSADQLNVENCIDVWRFARKYCCMHLLSATTTVIASNLSAVMERTEFLETTSEEFFKLLMSEAVISADSDARCRAGIAWLNYKSPTRVCFVDDIWNIVPFDTASRKTLLLAHASVVIRSKAVEKLTWLMADAIEKMDHELCRYKQQMSESSVVSGAGISNLYIIGGLRKPKQFLIYDVRRRVWSRQPDLPWERYSTGACATSGRLIVMGGSKNGRATADIDEYNPSTSTWSTSAAKLKSARQGLAVCTDHRYAYAIGGFEALDLVDKYSVTASNGHLATTAKMIKNRSYAAVAVPSGNEALFVAGGMAVSERLNIIEKYDIVMDKWSEVGKIGTARFSLAAAFLGDDIYIAGGLHDPNVVEVFNMRSGQTRTVPEMPTEHYGCSAVALDHNVMCVLGGADSRAVEAFDVREGKWSSGVIVPDMPEENNYFGFACL